MSSRAHISNQSGSHPSTSNAFSAWLEKQFHPVQQALTAALAVPSRLLDRLDPVREWLEGTRTKKVLQASLFPVMLAFSLAVGFKLVEHGVTRHSLLGLIILFLCYGLLFAPLERLIPFSHKWMKNDDASTDLMIFVGNRLWNMWIKQPLRLVTIVVALEYLSPIIGQGVWPVGWHPLVQVFLLLSFRGFLVYWYHRWMHVSKLGWRWHVVHHASERLYWLNGSRTHPFEGLAADFLWAIPLAVVQAPAEIVFVTVLLLRTIGRFQHCNLDLILGPLDYIFCTPVNHRYHHSREPELGHSNFGGGVIFWDILFGTFHLPKGKRADENIGVRGMPEFPKSWSGLMLVPFTYGSLKREARLPERAEALELRYSEQPG